MKTFLPLLIFILCIPVWLRAQDSAISLRGRVISASDSLPLPGASITIKGSVTGTTTDSEGNFQLAVPAGEIVVFSYIGFSSREIPITAGSPTSLTVILTDDYLTLGEVEIYSTGYQEVPAERATGSFEHIDNKLFNRSVSTDVISRLEGVTSGLLFDHRLVGAGSAYGEDYSNLRIRGISSINTDTNPLIVVDNFPYEGDLNNINPNDIESVTILKDAAAASIWGARAANGVIVISTKKGSYNQPLQVNFNTNVTVGKAPDLYYNPNFLPSPDFIKVEQILFDQGYYDADENNSNKPLLSPAVEILIKRRDGIITPEEAQNQLNALSQRDVREDAEKYLYQNSIKQQYAINVEGGSEKAQFYVSGGYDKNLSNIVGNGYERITFNTSNTFRPVDRLKITADVALTQGKTESNGISWGSVATRYPYNRLADEAGNPLPVGNIYRLSYIGQAQENGLLDWQYRPLEEMALNDDVTPSNEYRINTALQYKLIKGLTVDVTFQYQKISSDHRIVQSEESYYVRNMVNRFTPNDDESEFPLGEILNLSHSEQKANSGRIQINYNHLTGEKHQISGLAGTEVRQVQAMGNGFELYGYDDDVLTFQSQLDYTTYYDVRPRGRSRLPAPSSYLNDLTDRYISYFGNAAYTYDNRFTLSGSVRWDASNLFGVKTNQKGVPLWSVGGSWTISNENFYHASWLPYLRLRSTYGYNGNINKSASAFVTSSYTSSYITDFQVADIQSPGNPQLRWEKVGIWNIGFDMKSINARLYGSLEYYSKNSKDLLAALSTDPTTGFINQGAQTNLVNYANTQSHGIDLVFNTLNTTGIIKWETSILLSHVNTTLTRFDDEANSTSISGFSSNSNIKLKEGEPIDGLYAIPWRGLDSNTGGPVIMVDDQPSSDYSAYFNNLKFDDLVYIGLGVPSYFGSVRNSITYKGLSLSANITWKAGYYFRRNSISYNSLFEQGQGHKDLLKRWQRPGDEKFTDVPAMPETVDASVYRDYVYAYSEILFEKGDHIRLQDIRLSYSWKHTALFKNFRVYFYANNLGFLWRANKRGLDPDYPNASNLKGASYSLGFNASL